MNLKITIGTVTDKGLNPKRVENEDRLLSLPGAGLFLVADGVGGRRAGQVASQTAVDVFTQAFAQPTRGGGDLLAKLKHTVLACNRRIHEAANGNAELKGMATTIALLAAVNETRAIIGHVGDSRVYRYDGRRLICETEDHSEVNEAVRAGMLSAAQAAQHPRRNVINRALGADVEVEADFKIVPLSEFTSFLLCSDGVTRHVPDHELAELMKSNLHPKQVCQQLKEICFARGAEDNLTAVVVDFGQRSYVEEPTRPAISKRVTNTGRLTGSTPSAAAPASRIEVDFSASSPSAPTLEIEPKQTTPLLKATTQVQAASKTQNAPPPKAMPEPAAALPRNSRWSGLAELLLVTVLLVLAFFAGQYFDHILAWVTGNPLPAGGSTIAAASDPELAAARALFEERRYDRARERFSELARAKPESAEYTYWLGRSQSALGQYGEAAKNLNEAARLNPKLPDVYLHLARAYFALGDRRSVDESLRKAQ